MLSEILDHLNQDFQRAKTFKEQNKQKYIEISTQLNELNKSLEQMNAKIDVLNKEYFYPETSATRRSAIRIESNNLSIDFDITQQQIENTQILNNTAIQCLLTSQQTVFDILKIINEQTPASSVLMKMEPRSRMSETEF